MKRIIKEYWVEIVALAVVAGGIVFLVNPFDFRQTVLRGIMSLGPYASRFGEECVALLKTVTLSDILVGGIAILAGGIVLLRIRYRFRKSHRWVGDDCPICGTPMVRIHRTPLDRVISRLLLPHARRYLCKNPDCRWSGLRYGRPHLSNELVEETG